MTLLVARQCRLLGAARSLRRLPAAITARAYADDASPQRPFRVRRVAGKTAGGPLRPTIEGNIVQFDASVNPVEDVKRGQPPNHRPPRNYNLLVTPPLHACEIGSVNSAILVPASVAATVGVVASLRRLMLTCADTRALRGEDRIAARRYRQWHRSRRVPYHAVVCNMAHRRQRLLGEGSCKAI